ncbi:MAG: hypothetical protein ACR2NW_06115 [Thermodesulfobacteriota bacterium]
MRNVFSALLILLFAISFSLNAFAKKEEENKALVMGEAVVVTADVVGVDRKDRTVTLKGEDGKTTTIEVPEEAQNFDQIDVGDTLVIEMIRGLALALAKPGELSGAGDSVSSTIEVSKPGEKPRMVAVETVDVLAEISAIDKKTREVSITGPMGNSITLQADESIENFDKLKVGDKVHARYTEAVAIEITEK